MLIERLPEAKEDIKMAPRKLDLRSWKIGQYTLEKEPKGLTVTDKLIGTDPGALLKLIRIPFLQYLTDFILL